MGVPLAPDGALTARLALEGITHRFGPAEALRDVSLQVAPGSVHALLGENGAGKTTLLRIVAGLLEPSAGTLRLDGAARRFRSPRDARAAGIGMVHQHSTAIPALTVAENVALAAGWAVRPAELARRVAALAERVGLPLDPAARVETLPVALKQRLEIVKALAVETRVLLLDEPTAVLAPAEIADLLTLVRRLAASGTSVVLITHKLDEALAAADHVTVLRRGRVTLDGPARLQTAESLATAMLGGAGAPRDAAPQPAPPGATLVEASGLTVPRERDGAPGLRDASLVVRAGEIVAVAGVEGSGQRELLRAVAGLAPPTAGTLRVEGTVAFVPEDRTTEGLIPSLSLTENVVLGRDDQAPFGRRILDWRAAAGATAALLAQHDVRAPGPGAPAAALSGGNQQKLVLARALARAPRVVVAENPTRGLDLAATAAVHARLRAAAAAGCAVLLASTDLDEVLAVGTRVVVAARGRLLEAPPGADRDTIGALMLAAPA